MQKRHRGREIGELGSYLNVSVQRTFDFYLVLALCQKDGEMYLAKASQENIHEVEKQLALYPCIYRCLSHRYQQSIEKTLYL